MFKEVGNCVRDRSLALRVFRSFRTDSFLVWYFQMVRETFPATEHHHFLVPVSVLCWKVNCVFDLKNRVRAQLADVRETNFNFFNLLYSIKNQNQILWIYNLVIKSFRFKLIVMTLVGLCLYNCSTNEIKLVYQT